jgi:DNA invertase Pin-like site-specific DNA recombinase
VNEVKNRGQLYSATETGVAKIVVYKVDRLSRSLLDFAKPMEVFDPTDAARSTCM